LASFPGGIGYPQGSNERFPVCFLHPADKEYLGILHLAAQESESAVEATLRRLLAEGQAISAALIRTLVQHEPGRPSPMWRSTQWI